MTRSGSSGGKRGARRPAGGRPASYADVERALTQHVAEVLEQIPLDRVQLCQPTDGGPPRIVVSVKPGRASRVPQSIALTLGRRRVIVACEAREDYEDTFAR